MFIPLQDKNSNYNDDMEDQLRKKKQQEVQQRKNDELKKDLEVQKVMEQQKILKNNLKKNQNLIIAYDYNGKILMNENQNIAKKGKGTGNNLQIVNLGYNIDGNTQIKQQQNNQTNGVNSVNLNQKANNINNVQRKKKQNSEKLSMISQDTAVNVEIDNNFQKMFEQFQPKQGVIIKSDNGDQKGHSGQEQMDRQQLKQKISQTQQNSNENKKRMTKKEYDEIVKMDGNYIRTNQYQNKNNQQDILDQFSGTFSNKNNKTLTQYNENLNYKSNQNQNQNFEETSKNNSNAASYNSLKLAGNSILDSDSKRKNQKNGNINVANQNILQLMLSE